MGTTHSLHDTKKRKSTNMTMTTGRGSSTTRSHFVHRCFRPRAVRVRLDLGVPRAVGTPIGGWRLTSETLKAAPPVLHLLLPRAVLTSACQTPVACLQAVGSCAVRHPEWLTRRERAWSV